MSFNGWQCQDGPKFPQTHETHPMPKINGNEIRPGNILEHDGGLSAPVKGNPSRPDRGGALAWAD